MLEIDDEENAKMANQIHLTFPTWVPRAVTVDDGKTKVVEITFSALKITSVYLKPQTALRFGKMLVKAAEKAMKK